MPPWVAVGSRPLNRSDGFGSTEWIPGGPDRTLQLADWSTKEVVSPGDRFNLSQLNRRECEITR